MFDRTLRRIRRLVHAGVYVVTLHAHEEMEADGLVLGDVERVLLTGGIVERQKDARTGEAKYVLAGRGMSNQKISVVAKLGPTGRLVIITVYVSMSEDDS